MPKAPRKSLLGPTSKKQEMMLNNDADVLVLGGAAGGGKVQPYSSIVYTPFGKKKMGDLIVGDIISSATGSPQKVLQIHEQGLIDVYKCTFDDGSTCDVGIDHLWLVKTTSKHKSKKDSFYSGYFSDGEIKTTKEIISLLNDELKISRKSNKKRHFIIPLCDPIKYNLNKLKLDIHPYVMGALLGDGCFRSGTPLISCSEIEIIEYINKFGYSLQKRNGGKFDYSFLKDTGVANSLKKYGLYFKKSIDKFIPDVYKYSSVENRFELIRGLMDTDGTVCSRGHLSYCTISKQLAFDVREILMSLGCSVKITKKIPICYNSSVGKKECSEAYILYIKSKCNSENFFNLKRKKERCSLKGFNGGVSDVGRRFLRIEFDRKEIGRCITVSDPSGLYVTNDFIVTHNSFMLHLIVCKYLDDPFYRATFLRRTTPQLMKAGNLWDKGHKVFGLLPKELRPRWVKGEKKMAIFPHGPQVEYSHCQHVSDVENFQGSEMTAFLIDEAVQFEWEQISYFFSRMRSDSKYKSRLIMATNPDPDHRIRELIEWYLDSEGYPNPDREGVIRYFLVVNDEFVWSNSAQELIDTYATDYYTPKPLSFSFVGSTIYDNPVCIQQNPGYVSFLEGLPRVEKARLLYGNWFVKEQASSYFNREDLKKVENIPVSAVCVRAWDKAGTEPSEANPFPDFTACIKMYKDLNGELYISGEFHHSCHDKKFPDVYGRFREKPGFRDNIILNQAIYDGEDCKIIIPCDPGAHGITEYTESAKKLAQAGFIVRKELGGNSKSKLQKFSPFSAAVQNGFVNIVENTFPNVQTLEAFYRELENFDGTNSSRSKKDDWVDAVSTAYNYLSKEVIIPKFNIPQCGVNSNITSLKKAIA